jgi:hypothetical protein
MVTPGEERLPGRRAERRRVETIELEPACRETLCGRRPTGSAEGARGAEADVVEEDDQDVRRAGRRPKGLDRREDGSRVPRVEGRLAFMLPVRDGKPLAGEISHGAAVYG